MSYLGELDSAGWEQRVAEQKANYMPPAAETPGFFEGSLKATGTGFLRGTVKMLDFLDTALPQGNAAPDIYAEEDASSYYEAQKIPAEQMDEYRQSAREDLRRKALDFWTPDPRTVGTAGRVLGGFSEMVMPLVVTRNPALLVGSTTLATGKEQIDAGVDAQTAGIEAAFAGAGTYAGFKVPIIGKTLTQRLASGAVGNTAINASITEAQRAVLTGRGYDELAQNYDPADVEARAVDLLTGLAFGATHHLATPRQRAAIATANDAKHYQADTAPGIPENATADAAHLRAMDTATEQIDTGESASVPEDVTQVEFRPKPDRPKPEVPEELKAFDAERAASVKSDATAESGGYDVAEGVLTDEQLKQFQGLRSDVPADQNVGGPGEGVPGRAGVQDAGGARREPLRVYRGAGRELVPEDFLTESLGHASGKPAAGLGVFFSKSSEQAAQHGPVAEHFLDIRNPKVFKAEDLPGFDSKEAANAFSRQLETKGHDGIVIDASGVGGPVNYVAFRHEQVLKPEAVAKPKSSKTEKAAAPPAKEPAATEATAEDPHVTATRDLLAKADVKVPTGAFDAEGKPEMRSARELMAEADAEVADAETMGQGVVAAVSCFLSRGE